MSWALDAIILLRLDMRAGEHVGVSELARHLQVNPELVAMRLEVIAGDNGLVLKRVNGLVFSAGVPRRVLDAQPAAPGVWRCA